MRHVVIAILVTSLPAIAFAFAGSLGLESQLRTLFFAKELGVSLAAVLRHGPVLEINGWTNPLMGPFDWVPSPVIASDTSRLDRAATQIAIHLLASAAILEFWLKAARPRRMRPSRAIWVRGFARITTGAGVAVVGIRFGSAQLLEFFRSYYDATWGGSWVAFSAPIWGRPLEAWLASLAVLLGFLAAGSWFAKRFVREIPLVSGQRSRSCDWCAYPLVETVCPECGRMLGVNQSRTLDAWEFRKVAENIFATRTRAIGFWAILAMLLGAPAIGGLLALIKKIF
jgi:hypothetical protein